MHSPINKYYMTKLQIEIYSQVLQFENMSDNAFLMAWDDYFCKNIANYLNLELFKDWLLK